jgi:hypothetical protein
MLERSRVGLARFADWLYFETTEQKMNTLTENFEDAT